MMKIIFLAISILILFRVLKQRNTNNPRVKADLSKKIANWKHHGGSNIKQERLYSSRHESTPSNEKAAEEIVTKHEKINREAMKNKELE